MNHPLLRKLPKRYGSKLLYQLTQTHYFPFVCVIFSIVTAIVTISIANLVSPDKSIVNYGIESTAVASEHLKTEVDRDQLWFLIIYGAAMFACGISSWHLAYLLKRIILAANLSESASYSRHVNKESIHRDFRPVSHRPFRSPVNDSSLSREISLNSTIQMTEENQPQTNLQITDRIDTLNRLTEQEE